MEFKQSLTEGTSISSDAILSLFVPGAALSIWVYQFALGEIFSNIVLRIGGQSNTPYIILFTSLIAVSILSGWIMDKKISGRTVCYAALALCGLVSLLSLWILSAGQLLVYSLLVGSGIGAGITGLRVYLSDLTEVDERGRVAGGLLFTSYASIVLVKIALHGASQTLSVIFVTIICLAGLLAYTVKPKRVDVKNKITVYGRTLQYFLISWLLFALAYGSWNAFVTPHPIGSTRIGGALLGSLLILGYGLAALVSGTSADWVGRRTVLGFALLIQASAYIIYGLIPSLRYLALVMETLSWGALNTVFLFIVWAEISKNHMGLFYGAALAIFFGGFMFSGFLIQILGPVKTVYASIASSAILISAIIPLYSSDEPPPKEKVKVREMATYMKEIKKLKV
jgi:MFS family permease